MDPPEEIVVPRTGHALLESKDLRGIVAALRVAGDGIPFEGHHLAGRQCIRQVGFALLEHGLRLLALGDIDVGTDDALRDAITIVRYRAARLDPSDLVPATDNAILAKVLPPPLCDSLLEVNVQPIEIVWVDSSSPVGAPCLYGSLGQAVNGCIARRNLHSPRADVEGEASDQADLPGEGELRVALGECLLRLLALRDVTGDAEQPHGLALGAAHNRAFERDPVHLAGMWVARRMHHTVFGAADVSVARRLRKRGIYARSVIGMNEAPPFFDGLGQRCMAVIVRRARIALDTTRVEVQAEHPELGAAERQLEALVADLERRFVPTPLRE